MICIKEKDFLLNEKTIVTLGKFDGIHRGHRKLINVAKELADENNLPLAVFTFKVADGEYFPYMDGEKITTFKERERIFKSLGVDILVEYPFDRSVADTEPIAFMKHIIKEKMNASYVVVGQDWTFGKDGAGNTDLLKASQKLFDFTAVIVEKEIHDGREIGSSWIRDEIKAGRMETASILLDYPHSVYGEVVHGNDLGRTIGFPTANIIPEEDKLLPPYGVYASKVLIDDKVYYGVTNIGVKPTITDEKIPGVETYIIDFSGDIYGKEINVELIHFQRPEMKFQSVDMLQTQLMRDVEFARTYFLI